MDQACQGSHAFPILAWFEVDVFETIQKRKSVRTCESTPVPEETLAKLLEAADG